MWICFWSVRSPTPGIFWDSWVICDDEVRAQMMLDEVKERDSTYCAGIGPISNSTEHWHVSD